MRNCIKCEASIDPEVNFCPRCGAAQTGITSKADSADLSKAETLNVGKDGFTTLPDTIRLRPPSAEGAITTDMSRAGTKKLRNVALGVTIFVLSIFIGALLALGLRAYKKEPEQVAVKPPPAQTAPPSSVVIEEPKQEDPKQENVEPPPTAVIKPVQKGEERVDKKPNEPRNERPTPTPLPRPPVEPETFPEDDPEESLNGFDRGVISVRFNLVGQALVKIQAGEAFIIPLARSTISDVRRRISRPLPAQPCVVRIRQRRNSDVVIDLVERPNARNNFTATVRVTNTFSDYEEARAGFVLVWRLL
jgi:hypothetical protein